jgi:hypothetical protein
MCVCACICVCVERERVFLCSVRGVRVECMLEREMRIEKNIDIFSSEMRTEKHPPSTNTHTHTHTHTQTCKHTQQGEYGHIFVIHTKKLIQFFPRHKRCSQSGRETILQRHDERLHIDKVSLRITSRSQYCEYPTKGMEDTSLITTICNDSPTQTHYTQLQSSTPHSVWSTPYSSHIHAIHFLQPAHIPRESFLPRTFALLVLRETCSV